MTIMNKNGVVYRDVVETLLKNRKSGFVERELARKLGLSPDTVSRAMQPLKQAGIAVVYRRHFEIINFDKLLAYWAVERKFDRDIVYSTLADVRSMGEIEDRMPSGIAFTCFSAYVHAFGSPPADYGHVYVYAQESVLDEIMRRFPKRDISALAKKHNLFVLKPDRVLERMISEGELAHSSVPISQLYVDLWNVSSWNAYEFLKRVKEKIDDAYAKAILE